MYSRESGRGNRREGGGGDPATICVYGSTDDRGSFYPRDSIPSSVWRLANKRQSRSAHCASPVTRLRGGFAAPFPARGAAHQWNAAEVVPA